MVKVTRKSSVPIARLLSRYGDKAVDALKAEMYQEAEGIMAQSKELVPVDTGVLRGSGFVELPKVEGDRVHVDLGYGGAASGYALIVHENLDAFHPNGIAKFLEMPFNEALNGMAGRVARGIRTKVKAP